MSGINVHSFLVKEHTDFIYLVTVSIARFWQKIKQLKSTGQAGNKNSSRSSRRSRLFRLGDITPIHTAQLSAHCTGYTDQTCQAFTTSLWGSSISISSWANTTCAHEDPSFLLTLQFDRGRKAGHGSLCRVERSSTKRLSIENYPCSRDKYGSRQKGLRATEPDGAVPPFIYRPAPPLPKNFPEASVWPCAYSHTHD